MWYKLYANTISLDNYYPIKLLYKDIQLRFGNWILISAMSDSSWV